MRIGDLLINSGFISEQDLDAALRQQSSQKTPIGQLLKLLKYLREDELELVLQAQRRILFSSMSGDLAVASLKYAKEHGLSFAQATETLQSLQGTTTEGKDKTNQTSIKASGLKDPALLKFAGDPLDLVQQSDKEAGQKNWQQAISLLEQARSIYEESSTLNRDAVIPVHCRLAALYAKIQDPANARIFINKVSDLIHSGKSIQPGSLTLLAAAASLCFRSGMNEDANKLYKVVMPKWAALLPFEASQFNLCLRDAIACAASVGNPSRQNMRIGELLIAAGLIDANQFQQALTQAKEQHQPLGRILSASGLLPTQDLRNAMRVQLMCRARILPAVYAAFTVKAASFTQNPEEFFQKLNLPQEPEVKEKASLTELISKMDRLLLMEESLGVKDPEVALLAAELGDLCLSREEKEEAEAMYRRAHAVFVVSSSHYQPYLADTCQKIGKLLIAQKKYPEAELLLLQCMDIKARLLGEEHKDLAGILFDLGYLYFCQANFTPAIGFLRSAWMLKTDECCTEAKRHLLELLIKCFEQSGQTSEADVYREQLKSLRKNS